MTSRGLNINPVAGPTTLFNGNKETICCALSLSFGSWVIFGRIGISNHDGDAQGANVKLRLWNPGTNRLSAILDKMELRIPGGGISDSVSLEAVLQVGDQGFETVCITCQTPNGVAFDPQIIAISVDLLENQSPLTLPPGGLPL